MAVCAVSDTRKADKNYFYAMPSQSSLLQPSRNFVILRQSVASHINARPRTPPILIASLRIAHCVIAQSQLLRSRLGRQILYMRNTYGMRASFGSNTVRVLYRSQVFIPKSSRTLASSKRRSCDKRDCGERETRPRKTHRCEHVTSC